MPVTVLKLKIDHRYVSSYVRIALGLLGSYKNLTESQKNEDELVIANYHQTNLIEIQDFLNNIKKKLEILKNSGNSASEKELDTIEKNLKKFEEEAKKIHESVKKLVGAELEKQRETAGLNRDQSSHSQNRALQDSSSWPTSPSTSVTDSSAPGSTIPKCRRT